VFMFSQCCGSAFHIFSRRIQSLMTKNSKLFKFSDKKFYFIIKHFFLSLAFMKNVQATEKAFSPPKRISSMSKDFFPPGSESRSAFPTRIRIQPTKIKVDPCRSGPGSITLVFPAQIRSYRSEYETVPGTCPLYRDC
jgi:hypothetical protein